MTASVLEMLSFKRCRKEFQSLFEDCQNKKTFVAPLCPYVTCIPLSISVLARGVDCSDLLHQHLIPTLGLKFDQALFITPGMKVLRNESLRKKS
jgi:hypothetical protein